MTNILELDYIKDMPVGEEMDSLLAEKVMGWHILEENGFKHWVDSENKFQCGVASYDGHEDDEDFHILRWHPSESALWAVDVVAEKFDTLRINKSFGMKGVIWIVKIGNVEVFEETLPLALCRAALLKKLKENDN